MLEGDYFVSYSLENKILCECESPHEIITFQHSSNKYFCKFWNWSIWSLENIDLFFNFALFNVNLGEISWSHSHKIFMTRNNHLPTILVIYIFANFEIDRIWSLENIDLFLTLSLFNVNLG